MWRGLASILAVACAAAACASTTPPSDPATGQLARGKYLARLGVCEACHTPPVVEIDACPADESAADRKRRTDPDWYTYLDARRTMAGGVPFLVRIDGTTNGVVHSRNVTPDPETGIGRWTDAQIKDALRTGRRPDGSTLFRFAPHTFYENLAEDDLSALVAYLRNLQPVRHQVTPPAPPFPLPAGTPPQLRPKAPTGRTAARAEYLMDALVGCKECHSHHDAAGKLQAFTGGDARDPVIGVFRLGPDLPLRQAEHGLSAFPYPGYALLWGGNLTQFGRGGPSASTPASRIVKAMREGVATDPDAYGRPRPLQHVMMWQFYADMSDDDAYAIANYIKGLDYVAHPTPPMALFGADRTAAFSSVFGAMPSAADRRLFGLDAPVGRVACVQPGG